MVVVVLVIRSEGKILQQGYTAAVVLVWFALKHQHRPSKGGLYRTISIDETKGFVKQSKKKHSKHIERGGGESGQRGTNSQTWGSK